MEVQQEPQLGQRREKASTKRLKPAINPMSMLRPQVYEVQQEVDSLLEALRREIRFSVLMARQRGKPSFRLSPAWCGIIR